MSRQRSRLLKCPPRLCREAVAGALLLLPTLWASPSFAQTHYVAGCDQVPLSANVQGAGSTTVTWRFAGGPTLVGNPATLDTELLSVQSYSVQVEAANASGSTTTDIAVVKEDPSYLIEPSCEVTDGTEVQCSFLSAGARQIRYQWGDGGNTGWLDACTAESMNHTYLDDGIFDIRIDIRGCPGSAVTRTRTVGVGAQGTQIRDFKVVGCDATSWCFYPPGQSVPFITDFSGTGTWTVDWDGDGIDDETLTGPPSSHVFEVPGILQPRLTLVNQGATSQFTHEKNITISGDVPGPGVFYFGFESGDLGAWSGSRNGESRAGESR